MAKCPRCQKTLKLWNVKAECPFCGANIPNYNWEERLEQDSVRSDAAFGLLKMRKDNVKNALFLNRLFVVRFICTFLPLVLLFLPICKAQISLPFISGKKSFSIFNIILYIISNGFDFASALKLMGAPVTGKSFTFLYVALGLLILSILVAVVSFVFLIIRAFSLGGRLNIICNALSIINTVAAIILLPKFFDELGRLSISFAYNFSFGICLFAGLAIYLLNMVLAILCEKKLKPLRCAFLTKHKELKSKIETN